MLGMRSLNVALFAIVLLWIAIFRMSYYFSFAILLLCSFSMMITFSITHLIKKYFHRTRPCEATLDAKPLVNSTDTDSFPSDHAAASFCVATCIGVFQQELILLAIAVACAISFSRFFARLHYPTDILAGAGVGVAVGIVCSVLVRGTMAALGA